MGPEMKYLLLLSLSLLACSAPKKSVQHHQNALIDQILKPRPGYQGNLTNRACLEYYEERCKKWNVITYDMTDESFRLKANDLGFICNIAGHRYKICKDKAGFCHHYKKKKCWLKYFCWKFREEKFILVDNYKYLLEAKARCFNLTRYPFLQ